MKLRNLFTDKKRNVLLVSEGGAGKSSCALDAFLFFARNYGRYRTIPVYLPLNRLENTENPVYHFFGAAYTGTTSKTVLHEHLGKSKSSYLFLADGLNELPDTDTAFRQNVIRDILDLSELPNVSVTVISRYREIRLADFEQYELSDLSSEIVRSKVPDYRLLSNDMQTLLRTPFNLCLYLNLTEQYRSGTIRTTGDLILANMDMLRDKLYKNGYRKILIDFLFDAVLPVIAYRMCRNNVQSFSYAELTDTAAYDSELLKREGAYGEACRLVQAQPELIPVIFREMILDNAIVYASAADEYSFIHEQYRDHLGAAGFIFTAERFKLFFEKEGESLPGDAFSVPVLIRGCAKELVDKKSKALLRTYLTHRIFAKNKVKTPTAPKTTRTNYCNYLFDQTTRGVKNSPAAARFNKSIIDFIGFRDRRFHLDFSDLDLTQVDFSDSRLENCRFSGALLDEKTFSSPTSESPIGVWNNDDIAVVFYGEGFLQRMSINSGETDLIKTPAFSTLAVREPYVYLYIDRISAKTILGGKNVLFGEVYRFNLNTWELDGSNILRVPKKALAANSQSDGITLLDRISYDDLDLLDTFLCRSLMFDSSGRLYVFTQNAAYCFSENDYSFLQTLSFNGQYRTITRDSRPRSWTVMNPSGEMLKKYIVLEHVNYLEENDDAPATFAVCRIDDIGNIVPLKDFRLYQYRLFAGHGRVLSVIPSDDSLLVCTIKDDVPVLLRFIPESGEIKAADEQKKTCLVSYRTLSVLGKYLFAKLKVSARCDSASGALGIIHGKRFIRFSDPVIMNIHSSERYISLTDRERFSVFSMPEYSDDTERFSLADCALGSGAKERLYSLQDRFKPDRVGLRRGSDVLEYDIRRRIISRAALGKDEGGIPEEHDAVSYSLIGCEQYPFSKFYLDKSDYCKAAPDEISRNSFHYLADTSHALGTIFGFPLLFDFDLGESLYYLTLKKQKTNKTTLYENYYHKFRKAVFGVSKSLYVLRMMCVYHRFIAAFCLMIHNLSEKAPCKAAFLILDLKTNRLKRINTDIYVASEPLPDPRQLIWVDPGEGFNGADINSLFWLTDNTLYELSLNLKKRSCSIVHETILLPHAELLNCDFSGAEVFIGEARQEELTRQGKSIEAEKRRILDSWKENVIYDKLPEERR